MKFQNSSFNGLKVNSRYKKCDTRTHALSKSNMPHQLCQSWGHKKWQHRFPHYKSMGIFSDAQRQLTWQSVVGSGRTSNLSQLSCMFLLPASIKKIR